MKALSGWDEWLLSMFSLPVGVVTLLMAAFTVVLTFFILSFPLRLLIVYSKNYKIAIRCRMIADWLLFFIIIVVLFQTFSGTVQLSLLIVPEKDMFWAGIISSYSALMLIVPFYYLVNRLVNRVDFYSDTHVPYLDYFILYLRSFKDDKHKKSEKKLIKSLARLYYPFAIGKPDEFMPQRGAKRIYVGDNWQEVVIGLQQKAPLILQRVNISESFLWEFDQCVKGGYLQKVLFWVADYEEYEQFRGLIASKYGLLFPDLDKKASEEQLFYYLPDGSFRVYPLSGKHDYKSFARNYLTKDHPEHAEKYSSYLYGRSGWKRLLLALRFTYDKMIPEGVNQWSWAAFWFPEFYLICQPIKYRFWWFLVMITIIVYSALGFVPVGIGALFMFIMVLTLAKNGRTITWVSQRWESVAYFDKRVRERNILVVILGICRVLTNFGIVLFLLFNPFGWNIPHYDFVLW